MDETALTFSELVAPPARGRIFAQPLRGGLADCTPSGRVRLDALARWLQDVAYADVEEAGLASASAWVVRRTRLRVARFPRFGEHLEARTFCSGLGRLWAERRTTIARPGAAGGDVEAVALWIHLDPVSWRPAPLAGPALELYRETAGERRVKARLRHPLPQAATPCGSWWFRASELDLAGHINNAAYWQALEDELLSADGEPSGIDAEIEYRAPAQPGELTVLARGNARWLAGRELHASLRFELLDGA